MIGEVHLVSFISLPQQRYDKKRTKAGPLRVPYFLVLISTAPIAELCFLKMRRKIVKSD